MNLCIRSGIIALTTLFLFACGSESEVIQCLTNATKCTVTASPSPSPTPETTVSPSPSPDTLTVVLVVKPLSATTLAADGTSTTILSAYVSDSLSVAISGKSVTLTVPSGGGTITSANPTTTNTFGFAEFTLRAPAAPGTFSYTATADETDSNPLPYVFTPYIPLPPMDPCLIVPTLGCPNFCTFFPLDPSCT